MGYHHFVALCGLFIMMWYDRTGELWFDLKNDLCMGESGMICCNGFVWKYRSQNPANDHRPEIGIFCACLGQAKNFSTESPLPRKRFIVRWSPQSTMGLPMKPSLRPRIFRKRRSRWRKLKFHSQSQDRTDQILHRISWSRGTLRAAPSHCKWVQRTFYLTFYSTFSTQFLPICFFFGALGAAWFRGQVLIIVAASPVNPSDEGSWKLGLQMPLSWHSWHSAWTLHMR